MPTIVAAGEKLNYQIHRNALQPASHPLVLIHGAGGNLMHWPGDLRRLPDCTVYALDLPGHGGSAGHGRDQIVAYAEVVRAFVEALTLPPCVLVGHSMGGAIALEFALCYPGRLAGLVLVGTGARLDSALGLSSGILNDFAATVEMMAIWAHGDHVDPNTLRLYARRLRELDPQVTYGDLLACDRFNRIDDVARIAVPTLVICGTADRMTPVSYSTYLADQIRGAQLLILPGAGHMVMLEQATIVADAIGRFVANLKERA
jgi:pimeloyl-ACP methyl ester carboxylesterase